MARSLTSQAEGAEPATGGPAAPQEYELKLVLDAADADRIAASPLLGGAALVARAQRSVYFDSPDGALRRAGLSLRVRHIDDTHIQTLKMGEGAAAGLFVRPEWEQEISGDRPIVDDCASPLRTLIAPQELAKLAPAFEVAVNRRSIELPFADGVVELALDAGEVSAGRKRDTVCELELELKGGDPAALFGFARSLNEEVPLRLGVLTKSERGHRLIDGASDKAVKAQPTPLNRSMTATDGFAAIAHGCLRQFRLNEDILIGSGGSGALHQARVALRRLRSALSIFKPILIDDHFDHMRGELRWLAGALGEARNIDVLLARIGSRRAARPLNAAREIAYSDALGALGSERARLLMIDFVEWLALGAWRRDADRAEQRDSPLPAFADDVLERYRRKLKRRGRKLADVDDEARHELRIEAKKLRYSVEFFAGLYAASKRRRRHAKFLGALETLQDRLGDLNDLATEPEVLAKLGLEGSAAATALAADHQSKSALVHAAADAHAELIDVKRFWD